MNFDEDGSASISNSIKIIRNSGVMEGPCVSIYENMLL